MSEDKEKRRPGCQAIRPLKPFPGCLHINEHPIFSSQTGAPAHCILSKPPPSLTWGHQASHLLGLSQALSHPAETPGALERAEWGQLPTLDSCTQDAVCAPTSASPAPRPPGQCPLVAKCLPSGVGQGGWVHRQGGAGGRQGPEESCRPPTATGTVRRAVWKQSVEQRPVDTHTGRERKPSQLAFCPGASTPMQVRCVHPAPGPRLHTQAGPLGAAMGVTLLPTELEEGWPQALEVEVSLRITHHE